MDKWPPDISNLEESIGYKDIEKLLTRYMKTNNFKFEEIQYIYTMMNTFCYLNKPKDK
jgi:hypothetical protein